uniref:RGS domain-containing protein n=1 Tax=Panagrolaimus sp. PS1159 TaxID=55785 RepID=A0AC35EZ93_9BILA
MGNSQGLAIHNADGLNAGQGGGLDFIDDKASYEEVAGWGVAFDRLMKNKTLTLFVKKQYYVCLPCGQKYFAEFLKSEYSDENILFWQACEELKRERNTEKIEEKARIIYEDFISILSPKEVSLDSRVREIINNNMVHPTAHTFDEAQNQIYTLMQRDSYPRFIASALYKKILSSYGHIEEL